MLAADPSSPVGCEVELPWIKLVGPAYPTNADLEFGGQGNTLNTSSCSSNHS